ncbi:MAG: hypothetical protein NDI69_15470 [Bacteriovoracaceae bacterium]|nr:hypothetical protein [Bacteriovoracaceae bacterium]
MKHLILFSLVIFSSLVQAEDLAMKLQDKCDTKEAKRLMGRNGSCRVVVAPRNLNDQGYCSGVFQNSLTCTITYLGDGSSSSLMNLNCGTADETVVNEDMAVEAIDYNVATLISSQGRTSVIEDTNLYRLLSSKAIQVSFIKGSTGPVKGEVIIHLEDSSIPLTDVVCE